MHGNDTLPVQITYLEISNKNMILTNSDLSLNCCSLKAKRSENDKIRKNIADSDCSDVPGFSYIHPEPMGSNTQVPHE